MKTLSQRYAWIIIAFPIAVLLTWLVFLRPDPRMDCHQVTPELVRDHWTSGKLTERRLVVNCLLGGHWRGSALARINKDSLDKEGYEFEASLLHELNKSEVIELLGPADSDRENYLRYDLGIKPQSPFEKLLNTGWPLASRSLAIEFDETTGLVDAIIIQGQ